MSMESKRRPRIFVSYSWDTEDHKDWVRSLAVQLRIRGIEARLDAWRDENQSIDAFMMAELEDSDVVLAICTPTYKEKVLARARGEASSGSGIEFVAAAGQDRVGGKSIVPVLAAGNWSEAAPTFLVGHRYYDLATKDAAKFRSEFDELVYRLLGYTQRAPEIGEPPPPPQPKTLPSIFPDEQKVAPLRRAAPPAESAGDEFASGQTFAGIFLNSERSENHLASCSPIVIALEESDNLLQEAELLKTERHLSVSLSGDQLTELRAISAELSGVTDQLASLRSLGRRVWRVLQQAQPSLKNLLQRVAQSANPQPIAWTGKTELLVALHRLLLIAYTNDVDDVEQLVSCGFGCHYFHPIGDTSNQRTIQQRPLHSQNVKRVAVYNAEKGDTSVLDASTADIAMLVGENAVANLQTLSKAIGPQASIRVAVAIGHGNLDSRSLETALRRIPCISVGGPKLWNDDLLKGLARGFDLLASRQAIPCILAAARRAWLEMAHVAGDTVAFADGLFWSVWSWVGRPLFANDFGEVVPASYPHLMDLRSIRGTGWYYNRVKDIDEVYQADTLVEGLDSGEQFHLYLSGAGGTGKSCFLRYIYDQYLNRSDTLAVWYRVDAPSSNWDDVAKRIKEEIQAATQEKLGAVGVKSLPKDSLKLRNFLREFARQLRSTNSEFQIVLFIDQLERTFESGDEPNQQRLEEISGKILRLLKTVEVGEGVRVFIASRKQYLPDFLGSYRAATKSGLQFNVLQSISDGGVQVGFVRKVLNWLIGEQLVAKSVEIKDSAAELIADKVEGHPLKMMLALIHIFSQRQTGEITDTVLGKERPWEHLFDLDLQVAAKNDIDWYFILAMAHARTEIVRFEEVWWRLRLVRPTLTRQVDDLWPSGVLERLWLLGYLGRTIHARPYKGDPARFLEFFHANLRDYLLREVMGQGGTDLVLAGRRMETPPVWRALDRLSIAAHEWEQTQQLLPYDDVEQLIDQREVVVEKTHRQGEDELETFHLLFLRDSETARNRLCRAARECFAFSALVHDLLGQWAIEKLFPDVETRIKCCSSWLQRGSVESRPAILRYLIGMKALSARQFTSKLIMGDASFPSSLWQEIAQILTRPLFAARYRTDVVANLLESAVNNAGHEALTVDSLPLRVREFISVACNTNRDELVYVLSQCSDRLRGLRNERLRQFASHLAAADVETWLAGAPRTATLYSALDSREATGRAPSPIAIVCGSAVFNALGESHRIRWRTEVANRLGVPLPEFGISSGELQDHEVELRLHGQKVAFGAFYPSRSQILKRHWRRAQMDPPVEAIEALNDALQEVVLWVDTTALAQVNLEAPALEFEAALLAWLEEELGKAIAHFFDFDLLLRFLAEITTVKDNSRLFHGVTLQTLRQVIVNLVEERVPLSTHREELVNELQQLVREVSDADSLTERLRDHVKTVICQTYLDETGQMPVLALDEELERALASQVRNRVLRVDPEKALALASAVRGHVQSLLRDEVQPVLVCVPTLRLPLARMLRRFDPRVIVLSFTELSSDLYVRLAGVVTLPPATKPMLAQTEQE